MEHGHLKNLQRYRRLLRQRSAALRQSLTSPVLDAWEEELDKVARQIDESRRQYFETLATKFRFFANDRFSFDADIDFSSGWNSAEELRDRWRSGRAADLERGFTQLGPHRAELRLRMRGQTLRNRSSRGQQKMLGSALVLATLAAAPIDSDRAVRTLLVDEPGADLDSENFRRLAEALQLVPAQQFVASVRHESPLESWAGARFHVEHGEVKPLI